MNEFVPAESVASLSKRCGAALTACGELLEMMRDGLPEDTGRTLDAALMRGCRIGIEATVDHRGTPRLSLIAIEPEGIRHVVSQIKTIDQGNATEH